MSVHRPNDYNIDRIQPVHGDHNDDDQNNPKKKKKVHYQGRSWSPSKEDLPIDSSSFEQPAKTERDDTTEKHGLYADKPIIEKAKEELARFTTLEEKVASLCFYEAEASYDPIAQEELEIIIQKWQVGGIVFKKGDFKRQSYLIEHLQDLAKTQLLIGNDFFHGLSFYFEGSLPLDDLQNKMDEKHYADLGKAVVAQNRRLGVHFQFDRPLNSQGIKIKLSDENIHAFRKGIKDAKGIVGKERKENQKPSFSQSSKKIASFKSSAFLQSFSNPFESEISSFLNEQAISETTGLRNIDFIDLTMPMTVEYLQEFLVESFKNPFDALLLSGNVPETIAFISELVRSGKIDEEEVDKRALRILLIKRLL